MVPLVAEPSLLGGICKTNPISNLTSRYVFLLGHNQLVFQPHPLAYNLFNIQSLFRSNIPISYIHIHGKSAQGSGFTTGFTMREALQNSDLPQHLHAD